MGNFTANGQALDELVQQRRHAADRLAETMARSSELGAILARFAKLEEVYRSDAERLHGLEEASFLLKVKAGRPCPLCGAAPEHGRHQHDASDVERARYAALAEIERVEAERADLQRTMVSLHAEGEGLRGLMDELQRQVHRLDSDIEAARPKEARSRAEHEDLLKKRATLQQYEELFRQREHLQERRTRLTVPLPRPAVGKELPVGVDGATGHAFATIVQNILADWHFPGTPVVSFDTKSHDILLNGKGRDANGKGVRALLHAAFKIGVLVFCRAKGLPHPGFVVLDTPLLTYREPLKTPKHGELSADEEEVKRTSLNEHFYRYLVGLREHAQILVLENTDPPGLVAADAVITPFTGQLGDGRFGYFPIRPPRPSTKSKRKQPAGGVAVANTTTRLG